MTVYRTIEGDMIDAICKDILGDEGHAPAVLDANPGLAALGPIYPEGIKITIPDIPDQEDATIVRLWGSGK